MSETQVGFMNEAPRLVLSNFFKNLSGFFQFIKNLKLSKIFEITIEDNETDP
jgi:hypothetical protein